MEFQRICLIHYHEIGLKGRNRSTFEMRLVRNVEALLKDYPVVTIHRISGRLLVFISEGTSYEVACEIEDIIAKIPGVARVSCGYKCARDMAEMTQAAICALSDVGDFETFKVIARRNHTDFPLGSMEIAATIGGDLCAAFPEKRVRMKDMDVAVGVEVIQGASYVYARSIPGVGGLPVGSSGRVITLLSSGIDSPVATWRMARRGAISIGVHFSGRPQTSSQSEFLVQDIARVLERSGSIARVYIVPFGDYQREIALVVKPSLRVIMYRRLMFKVAERIAEVEGARALATGESLGQVASQTIDNMFATNAAVSIPVFRPLIGSDKLEIIRDAQQVGTFEISSQDAPDCCTLFMPRNPETHAKYDQVLEEEEKLPIDTWVDEILSKVEVHDYACPSYKPKPHRQHD